MACSSGTMIAAQSTLALVDHLFHAAAQPSHRPGLACAALSLGPGSSVASRNESFIETEAGPVLQAWARACRTT